MKTTLTFAEALKRAEYASQASKGFVNGHSGAWCVCLVPNEGYMVDLTHVAREHRWKVIAQAL